MKNDDSWIVWLTQGAGEIFLGLPSGSNEVNHRFCVLGRFIEEGPSSVGVWMDVDFVQEVVMPENTTLKTWEVKPSRCLIFWAYISYVQRGEHSGKIGFTPTA